MSKYSIAIVDDQQEILDVLERFLKRNQDFEVTTFLNPMKFLLEAENKNFDLALLDIMMPQISGLEVLEKLKTKNPNQKVIMMTAYSTLDKVMKSHKEGAANYIMKPFNSLDALQKQIMEVLSK